ncbi:MAG TPA: bifunctional glutamine-synthetase adenylyltransferase/deadenyltransferase, partial [Spirillospora sp.]
MTESWTSDRRPSLAGRLARLGFVDAARAERLLLEAGRDGTAPGDELLDALGGTADPDLALDGLLRLLACADERGAGRELRDALAREPGTRDRLTAVLGVSAALADHLARHPEHWTVLRDRPA